MAYMNRCSLPSVITVASERTSPCSNCRIGKTICRTTPRVKEQRQRVLISHQYEKKIETIDERLSTIERLLQDLTLSLPAAATAQSTPRIPQPPSSRHNDGSNVPVIIQNSEETETKRTPEFEGESSFSAHSVHAGALFESAMKRIPFAQVPMMSHALSALQDIIKRQSLPSSVNVLRFPGQPPKKRINFSELELPPSSAVLALLRLANENPPLFFLTLPVMNITRFTQMCKDLYFCTEEYSSGRFASVNSILGHLFKEISFRFKDDPATAKFNEYSELCMSNFTVVISSFDMFTEPSLDNLMALTYAVLHATEAAKISLCWNFVANAARMAQSLGYHRSVASKDDTPDDATVKIDTQEAYHKAHIQWIVPASELTYNLIATIIQRAAPPTQPPETPSGLNLQCVQAARKALQIHQQIFVSLEKADSFFFSGYITWVLLQCPFAPFMVTFCHTIAASDHDDLKLLGEVATSLRVAADVSEAADRLYRLCLVFYQVAKLYVDVQPKEPHDYPVIPKPGEAFDEYLTSLGFGPNTLTAETTENSNNINFSDPSEPSISAFQMPPEMMETDLSHTLGDWFLDNQYMMGLLDSDL
ncbi:fungal specific transcription factor domain-containing protein [Nannizzia gypsea CBS 118893]|uniref:Fungal specific transcription factor domain-containing protein n=1 Tax=Arthroderma gypseum (strain ATCC MYA-4604 / CBS 118893) TaxID=535722 RepID=E5R407_ARTGP|nr:fungal specific transcription factor domain-containing protein [Nannizzia gypsea CBS 118893]EFQ98853.1 fungal specific transcription factor domain-containing protein [Nannizzia gypsea CBS 118893]